MGLGEYYNALVAASELHWGFAKGKESLMFLRGVSSIYPGYMLSKRLIWYVQGFRVKIEDFMRLGRLRISVGRRSFDRMKKTSLRLLSIIVVLICRNLVGGLPE